VLIYWQKS